MEGRPRPGEAGAAAKEKVGGVHAGRRIEKDWIFGVAGAGGGVGADKRRSWRGGWMAREPSSLILFFFFKNKVLRNFNWDRAKMATSLIKSTV